MSETPTFHVLFADDDEDDRLFFEMSLRESGLRAKLSAVNDGGFLMAYINAEDSVKPDVIFLDINMPRKNGLECLESIRSKEQFKDVPVLMFSTSASPIHIDHAYMLGANRYVVKPMSLDEQVKLLREIFTPDWKEVLLQVDRDHFLLTVTKQFI